MFGRTALLRTVRRAPVSGLTRSSARALSVRAQPNGSSGGSGNAGSGSWSPFGFAAAATAGAAAFAFVSLDRDELIASARAPVDYVAIRKEIANVLENDDYDDGSYGPVLIRLAWHTSGTYDRVTGKGGSNGSRMRFDEEGSWGANAGLKVARDLLEPIKERHPEISYGDLWTLAGCVAIEEMGGPKIQWRPGRADAPSAAGGPPDGTLPDASQGADHVRDIFYRMGFSDREIVALVGGGHALGRCHTDRSGYEGPWSFSPTTFSNEYFRLLLESKWQVRPDFSPEQYEDAETKTLMMLPADMVMLTDKAFLVYTKLYAKDSDLFFRDFARAWEKLISLGVPGQ